MKSAPPVSPPPSPPLAAFLRDSVAPLLLLGLVQTVFAGYTVLTEAALKSSLSAVVFAFVRDVVACLAFAPTLYLSEAPPACCRAADAGAGAGADAEDGDDVPPPPAELWPRREHFAHFVALGLLCVWGGQLLGSISISYLSASLYGLLTPTVPAVTLLVSYLLGLEVFRANQLASWLKLLGIAVSIAGATIVVLVSPSGSAGKNNGLGFVYIIVQKICVGTYPVLQKHMLRQYAYKPLLLATWAYLLGTFVIGLVVASGFVSAADWGITATGAGAIVYSGLLSSYFNYGCMAWVNARTSPLVVTAFYPLQSVLTPLLSSIFLRTVVSAADVSGGATIVLGLFICLYGRYLGDERAATGHVEESKDAAVATIALTRRDLDLLADAAARSSADALDAAADELVEEAEEDGAEPPPKGARLPAGLDYADAGPGGSGGGSPRAGRGGGYGTLGAAAAARPLAAAASSSSSSSLLRSRASFAELAGPVLQRALSRQLDAAQGLQPTSAAPLRTHSGMTRRDRLILTASGLRLGGGGEGGGEGGGARGSERELLTAGSGGALAAALRSAPRRSVAVDAPF